MTFAALSCLMGLSGGIQPDISAAVVTSLSRFYVWALLTPFIFRFTRRFTVELRPLRVRRLSVHILAVLLFSVAHETVWIASGWLLAPWLRQHFPSLGVFFKSAFVSGLYFDIPVAALIVIAAHTLVYYRSYKEGVVQQSRLKAQLAQAQLQALKMQLHPHFLFNTLHSISSLVLEDPRKANSMLAQLGDFLRQTLEHSDRQLVPLKEEIEFLRCYLGIEQVRFEDRLTVEFSVEPAALAAYVPHLILQPIVENAIKHAIAPRSDPGTIRLAAGRLNGALHLEVKDDGLGIGADGPANGVGLSNVRARLEQIYGDRFSLNLTNSPEGGLAVVLRLPFATDPGEGAAVAGASI